MEQLVDKERCKSGMAARLIRENDEYPVHECVNQEGKCRPRIL